MPVPKARILIVDNDPGVGEDLRGTFEALGFSVCVSRGTGQALIGQAITDAHDFRPHISIVDARLLEDNDSSDASGLILLKTLHSSYRILYTAYLSYDMVRVAMSYGAKAVIGKDERLERLIDKVNEGATFMSNVQRMISVQHSPTWTPDRIINTLFPGIGVPTNIVEDVLIQFLPKCDSIYITDLIEPAVVTPRPVGRGRSVVLKAKFDKLSSYAVKFAPSELVELEAHNYTKHIQGNIVGLFHAQLEGLPITFWDLGVIFYSFIGSSSKDFGSLRDFYARSRTSVAILRPLRHFFEEAWHGLYGLRTDSGCGLFDSYDRALNLAARLSAFSNHDRYMQFSGLPIRFLNPVSWIIRHQQDSSVLHFREAVTHGDLHADNLFVDNTHAWAIDFERSGVGHILRDFVELEVDILTRLAWSQEPNGDLSRLFNLVVATAEPIGPKADFPLAGTILTDEEARKSYEVIRGLRRIGRDVTKYEDFRELLWGLLFDSAFVATLASEENRRRERALLCGSVLCSRLGHWGKEWPPEEWKPFLDRQQAAIQIKPAGALSIPSDQICAAGPQEVLHPRTSKVPTSLINVLGASGFLLVGTIVIMALWWAVRGFGVTWQRALISFGAVSIVAVIALALLRLIKGRDALEALLDILFFPFERVRRSADRAAEPKGKDNHES